jgi:hypothetical protein
MINRSSKAASKRYNGLNDKLLKEAAIIGHKGMMMAWAGEFDELWKNAPLIDGKSQRDIFFENVTGWLPEVDREAMMRKLHTKKTMKKKVTKK